MKKQLILIFLYFFVINLFSQRSAKVIYKLERVKQEADFDDQLKKSGFVEIYNKRQERIFDIAKDFKFILLFNPEASIYFWDEEMPDEGVNNSDFNMAILKGNLIPGGRKYQNKKENLSINQFNDPLNGKLTREVSLLDKIKWKITNETDTIMGYPVIKAIAGNREAWFTPDIPVPFGPGDGGLPGLIMVYQLKSLKIYADKITWLKDDIQIKKPDKGVLRTEEQGRAERMKAMKF